MNDTKLGLFDWFAGMALQGLITTTAHSSESNSDASGSPDNLAPIAAVAREMGWGANISNTTGDNYSWASILAEEAYTLAKAMMEERNQLEIYNCKWLQNGET